jgi:cold shock CspA family protein
MTGKCIEFDINKGYGTIIGEDNKNYFCHFSAIQSTAIHLETGERVSFEPIIGKRGAEATIVKAI